MTPTQLDFVRSLLRERAGIFLKSEKDYLFRTRLDGLAERMGMGDAADLVGELMQHRSRELSDRVVEVMTTNETSFFRDPQVFDALREDVLPELLRCRRGCRRLRIWSAASSSGQEAYSVLMLLAEQFPESVGWDVQVLATDVNQQMLNRTEAGLYDPYELSRGLAPGQRERHFVEETGGWRVQQWMRARVRPRILNLTAPWPTLPLFDLILLRNILIYFDAKTKQGILSQIRGRLQSDGYLVLGAAENTLALGARYERVRSARTATFRVAGG